jgi:hypothetical protein
MPNAAPAGRAASAVHRQRLRANGKIMPRDYRRALLDMRAERSASVAAE